MAVTQLLSLNRARKSGAILKAIATKLGFALLTLFAVSLLMFFGLALIPGDAAQVALGQQATPERLAALREQAGLDRPLLVQYWDWFTGVLRGDLGTSLQTGNSVWDIIGSNVGNSLMLASLAIIVMLPLAIILGVIAATHREKAIDHILSSSALAFAATPEFAIGAVLILIFASGFGILPATSLVDTSMPLIAQMPILILPVLTLVLVSVAQSSRMVRAAMIDVLQSDYVQAATLRGVPRRRIIFRHALPNAADSIVAIIVLTTGWLVGGVVVTESLFQFPGVGMALATAVTSRDIPTVLACALLITAVLIIANLIADVVILALNPRLRARKG